MQTFKDGLIAPLMGLQLFLRHFGNLWGPALLPLLLGLAWSASSFNAAERLQSGYWWDGAVGYGLLALVAIIQLFIALLSPVLDWLSERVEGHLPWAKAHESQQANLLLRLLNSWWQAFRLIGYKLLLLLISLPISWLPGGDWVVIPLMGFILALDFIDYPLARREWPHKRKVAWLRRHAPALLPFSTLCYMLLMTPGLGGLSLVPLVVGGTWLSLRLIEHDKQTTTHDQ